MAAISATTLSAVPREAHASFDGQSVTAEWLYPEFDSILESHTVIVGPGVELPPTLIYSDDDFSIDIGADYILFSFVGEDQQLWDPTAFNGWRFSDSNGTILEIIGYTIDSVSNGVSGLTDDALGFDADAVWADFSGVAIEEGPGDFIRLQVGFVPEPTALLLLLLGGPIVIRRRT